MKLNAHPLPNPSPIHGEPGFLAPRGRGLARVGGLRSTLRAPGRSRAALACLHAGIAFVMACAAFAAGAVLPRHSPVPGGIAVLHIAEAAAPPPRAWFGDRPLLVARDAQGWHAVVGLPLSLKPGRHAIRVRGASAESSESFEVSDKAYPEQRVRIKDKRKVTPNPEDLLRIEREQRVIAEVKSAWRDEPQVDLALRLPADGPLSSRFGLRRVFNGEPRQPHSGLDVALASGTPLRSAAAGRVANTGDYFFNGLTVFVDHGQGLITMYCHLSRIDVKAGEAVAQGQQIGLSGMTGRASGPHLHWSVMLNAAAVDPELLLASQP